MALADLADWLDGQTGPDRVWYVKRLSANDTGQTGGHQAGVYAPKPLVFELFPTMDQQPPRENLDAFFTLHVDSHDVRSEVRAIWYNNKYWKVPRPANPRDEARITRFAGTPLQDPENTGALAVFSFVREPAGNTTTAHAWVCESAIEEDLIEERTGPVEPGMYLVWEPGQMRRSDRFPEREYRASCHLEPDELPEAWRTAYPTGLDIISKAVEMRSDASLTPDKRLLRRRECEYELFLSIEKAIELPAIRAGFTTVEEFIARAQTVLQRRKSRSGRSLELHARAIFLEEGLREGDDFEWGPKTEHGNIPDFLFPNAAAYHDAAWPVSGLRLLAAKTTCKDRWRQVAREADRIPVKHLLTLQEGVSESQFRQMREAGVQLVVPEGLVEKYPKPVRGDLVTLESFIGDVRACRP
ncbi:type II restriction endonuclease [Mameliella sp. CS4]|uniref:type II restriction endonuclease n=1 Tax=Mameliella sp. CS4 TaxID=2862329 RepID=UPI001C5EDC9A|nr:type II restriction endonuclease [Mameliella sp. CS4]MBW4985873.1 type II restriction endonuclease [Mameliella sp. CS4]